MQLGVVYANHHGWLFGWLRRRLGNSSDAADLAQDTFLRVLNSRRHPSFGLEPRALLTHIAKGLVIDHWRRQEVERAYLEALKHLQSEQAPSPEARLLILEALHRIESMLRNLPERTRSIFLLAQLEGLTYSQIAEEIGISVVTVKRHMRVAFTACLAIT